jgi:deoxyribodipyrimidine photolyase-related protein
MKSLLIFPHQLFESTIHTFDPKEYEIVMHEHPLFFTAYRFHKTKLWFHRASMQIAREAFAAAGFSVRYYDYTESLSVVCQQCFDEIHFYDPVDTWLSRDISESIKRSKKNTREHTTPMFMLDDAECRQFADGKKSLRMQYFYESIRKKTGYLMEDNNPIGGKFSFDTENRKPYKGLDPLPLPYTVDYQVSEQHCIDESVRWVQHNFPDNPGEICDVYPVSWQSARERSVQFVATRLACFGPYEDAMVQGESELFHSGLSMVLNNGLLDPRYPVENAVTHFHNQKASIQSVEGFVRQIIGWREYMRLLYVVHGQSMRSAVKNKNTERTTYLSEGWYTGKTGIEPIDDSISKLLATGYNHHIERLMVIGNMMQLLDIHLDEVYAWFMMHYIDAYDWVMLGNIVAMSQYVDTTFTTKPYISGSRYILSMSNYSKGSWCSLWDGLYWDYIARHADEYARNPRMSMMVRMYEKMDSAKRNLHKESAGTARKLLTAPKNIYPTELLYETAIASKTGI